MHSNRLRRRIASLAFLIPSLLLSLVGGVRAVGAEGFPPFGGQVAPPASDSQRVVELDRRGGLIAAALPLPDGTILAAEGSALIRLSLAADPPAVLARSDPGYGPILALAPSAPYTVALAEQGVVTLADTGGDGLPDPVGFAPGGGQTLAAQGGLVVVAARGAGLRVLRIDAAGAPIPLATLSLPGSALDVALAPDGLGAYVAAGEAGVHLVDLADPSAPRLAGTLSGAAPADAVALAGSLLAVGSGGRVLLLDPASGAQPIGVYAPLREGQRIVVQDNFAYVADAADGLKIIWLAAPDRPVQVYGEADRPASDLWIEDDTAYVVGAAGLRILDVGNRYRPLVIADLSLPGQPQGIAVAGGRAFVALGAEGLAVVDVQNQAAPRLVGLIPLEGPASAVLYREGALYVAAGEAGLALIDASQPGGETLIGMFPLPGAALDLARRGDALYVAAGQAGLIALDITHPDAPLIEGVLPSQAGRAALSVTISGKRAYLAEGDDFLVVDVTRPDHIGWLARVAWPAQHVAAADAVLYALSGSQIAIYDAGASAEPRILRTYAGLHQVGRIAVQGQQAFLTDAGEGPDLVVLSLLAPDAPVELDSAGQTGHTVSVWPAADTVYLAAGEAGLRAYGLSEGGALIPRGSYVALPEAAHLAADGPRLLAGGRAGWLFMGGPARGDLPVRDLALDGDTVAVAAGDAGVALYSVTGDTPVLLARRDTSGPALGVALDENFVYVADAGGLSFYDRRYLSSVRRVPTPVPALDVALRNGLAYLPLADSSLAVIEVGDPFGGLRLASSVETRGPADLILALDGRTVYALYAATLLRLDTANPDRIFIAQSGALPEVADQGEFLQGGVLAALMPGQSLGIYDVSDLEAQAVLLSQMEVSAADLLINWPYGYAAYGDGGLGLVNVRDRTQGALFYSEPVRALHREGDTLFALGDALTAWDITRPDQPTLLATLPLVAPGRHIDPATSRGGGSPTSPTDLLLSLESGLSSVHWDGATLTETANLFTPGPLDRAARLGDRAYLALHDGGLLVADLSDLAQTASLFTYTSASGQFVRDLLPLDGTHLLVSWEGGIDVLDAGTPLEDAPHLLTALPVGSSQALGIALSADGSRAALALGEEGMALLSLADPYNPQVMGYADTPGAGLAVALDPAAIYVADGLCGLHVLDVSDPTAPTETGYWRGGYASDVITRLDGSGQPVITLAGGNQVVTLRFDPTLPPVAPPVPQSPYPTYDASGAPLALTLTWGPPADTCDPLTYAVYFGQTDDPPLLAQVTGDPRLEVPELTSRRTYSWRVEVSDRQGDRVSGPVWRFTTLAADEADTLPPAPPTFLAWIEQHPYIPAILIGLLLVFPIFLGLRRLGRPSQSPADLPDWYSTEEDDDESHSIGGT